MQTKIRWPHCTTTRHLELVTQQEISQKKLDSITRKEPARTRILPMSKMQIRLARRRKLVLIGFAWLLAVLIVPEAVEGHRVGCYVRVENDRRDRHHEMYAGGEVEAVGQSDGAEDCALESDCVDVS